MTDLVQIAAVNFTDKPMASAPWKSYRYKGRYGFIMIGAMNDQEALSEAQRSESEANDIKRLQRWNGSEYEDCVG